MSRFVISGCGGHTNWERLTTEGQDFVRRVADENKWSRRVSQHVADTDHNRQRCVC
jgi:hypothetical protein